MPISFKLIKECAREGKKLIKFGEVYKTPTFGKPEKVKIQFGKKTVTYSNEQINGVEIISNQNKASINFGQKSYVKLYIKYLLSGNLTMAQQEFFKATGLHLHIPNNIRLDAFTGGLANLENAIKGNGQIICNNPVQAVKMDLKGVKHVLIGHGAGVASTDSWIFAHGGGKVFDFINNNNLIKKGDKIIVMTCETGDRLLDKKAIGGEVSTLLTDSCQPGKIIEAGRNNEIIGQIVLPPYGSGITFY